MPSVGEKIRQHRKRQGLSQKALSERAGIAQASLSDLEHGRSKLPASRNLLKIAAVLGVDASELVGDGPRARILDKPRLLSAVVAVEHAVARSGRRLDAHAKGKLIAHLYEAAPEISESEALRLLELLE